MNPVWLLVKREEARCDRENPQWDEAHYADWARSDLVWRLLFLQSAGRSWYLHMLVWRDVVLPVACFVSVCIGFVLGACL